MSSEGSTAQRTAASPELLVPPLDLAGGRRAQLEGHLRELVRSGRLQPGARLPSSRALAQQLEVSRRLVVEAYAQLTAEGYLEPRRGSGTRVRAAPGLTPSPRRAARPAAARPRFDLFSGAPDLGGFPRRAWGAALRSALTELPDQRLGYGHPAGAWELRAALAEHLGRVRGAAVASGERVVVCGGYAQGLRLLLGELRARGASRVAVEEPGFPLTAMLIAAEGLEAVLVPADADGLVVGELESAGADAVVVTPAHGLPLGGVLSAERRAALVAWARAGRRLVVEDDYDGEFRYDAEPLGTLQGLAPDVVALVGTVSKTLAPALRLGWVVAPEERTAALVRHKALQDLGSPLLEQLALARLLSSGGFDRHVRTMRGSYRARRDALLAALAAELPEARVHGVAAGLHVLVELPAGTDEAALLAAAATRGLRLHGLAAHCAAPPPFPGVVLGYANHTKHELGEAVALLAACLRTPAAAPGRPACQGS